MRAVTRSGFFVQPGLFSGRAGILASVGMRDPRPTGTAELVQLVHGLDWHALPYGGGLAFPGDKLLRLSMDLATGTAGVLFGMATAMCEPPVYLPFLALADRPASTPTTPAKEV